MKKVSLMSLIILIFVVAVYFFSINFITPDIIKNPEATGVFEEKSLGFSVVVPDGFTTEKSGDYSLMIVRKTDEMGVGPTNYIYISFAPSNLETEPGEILNYNKDDVDILRRMQVGEEKVVPQIDDPNLQEYYRYKSIEGITIGGYGAKAFVNDKPWEFPGGTKEYKYLVEFQQGDYIIGGYLGDDPNSGYYISKDVFDGIVSSIRLNPESIKISSDEPTIEGDWKIYENQTAGLLFNYPGDWEIFTDGQNFEEGNLFTLIVIGSTQRVGTEMYDGVIFAVMNPIVTDDTLESWIKEKYEDAPSFDPENPPTFEKVSYSGLVYDKVTVCGLGCFPYYHIKVNGKIYGFLGLAVGPNEEEYNSMISKLLSSIEYL